MRWVTFYYDFIKKSCIYFKGEKSIYEQSRRYQIADGIITEGTKK